MTTRDKATDSRPLWPSDFTSNGPAAAVCATILYHPDPSRIGDVAWLLERGTFDRARIGRESPIFRTPEGAVTGPLGIANVSEREPLDIEGLGVTGVRVQAQGERMEVSVDGAGCERPVTLGGAQLARGAVVVLGRAVALLLHEARPGGELPSRLGFAGASPALRALCSEIRRVADQGVPVLVRGETGTGKELVARALHQHGARAHGPYVPINMAAIPASMAEAELFGYARGAFTGASRAWAGHFALANGGTLFLDEIGATPLDVQAKLLRVIEQRELSPLGSKALPLDLRIVAATDEDLERAVQEGGFRRPLLERLQGYPLRVPPLRERRDDIARLLLSFLRDELTRLGQADKLAKPERGKRPWLPIGLLVQLIDYPWPGNVRELLHVASQLAIANRDRDAFQLPESLVARFSAQRPERAVPNDSNGPRASVLAVRTAPSALRDDEIARALASCDYNLSRAATQLGISRTSLHARMESSASFRKAADLARAEVLAALSAAQGDVAAAAAGLRVSERGLRLHMRRLDIGLLARNEGDER
jgi:two-component system nitrogen regulation response regulator GlnG